MFKLIKIFLDMLPLNGKKTYLSILVTGLGVLTSMYPDSGILEHLNGLLLEWLGLAGITLGAAHKDLKSKKLM